MDNNQQFQVKPGNSAAGAPKPAANSHRTWYLLLVLVVIVIGLGTLYIVRHHKKTAQTVSAWTTYSSSKYGFKFDYLKAWGAPAVAAAKNGAGNHYAIAFSVAKGKTTVGSQSLTTTVGARKILITMDSDDVVYKQCVSETQCTEQPGINKAYVMNQLANPSQNIVDHTQSSYATVSAVPAVNQQSILDVYQIVSLPKLKVSAAHAVYLISGSSPDCQSGKFLAGEPGCVTPADYANLHRLTSSISPV